MSETRLGEVLKSVGRSGSGVGHNRLRSLLVAAEVALATVALIGSGLFLRSMQAAQEMDLGFDSRHIGFLGLNPGGQRYPTEQGRQFYRDALVKARAFCSPLSPRVRVRDRPSRAFSSRTTTSSPDTSIPCGFRW